VIKVSFSGLRERLQTLDRLERDQLQFAAALGRSGDPGPVGAPAGA